MLKNKKSLIRFFLNLPPNHIRLLLIAIFSAFLLLLFSGASIKFKAPNITVLFNSPHEEEIRSYGTGKIEPGFFHAFYRSYANKKRKIKCEEERVYLEPRKNPPYISGYSIGYFTGSDGHKQEVELNLKGMEDNNNLSLVYKTNDNSSGVYFLSWKAGEYVGYWLGEDSQTDDLVQCPYILVREADLKDRTCDAFFPDTLDKLADCKIILR